MAPARKEVRAAIWRAEIEDERGLCERIVSAAYSHSRVLRLLQGQIAIADTGIPHPRRDGLDLRATDIDICHEAAQRNPRSARRDRWIDLPGVVEPHVC